MSDNLNLRSFGYNVINPGAGHQSHTGGGDRQAHKPVEIKSTAVPAENFFDKYENVLNGKVEHEIGTFSRQNMLIAMNLKASDGNIRRFDVSI